MGIPALAFPASGLCQAEREAPSIFFSSFFSLLIQRTAAGGYLSGSQPDPGAVLLSSRFPHAVCAFALPSPQQLGAHQQRAATQPPGAAALFIGRRAWMKISRMLWQGLYRHKKLTGPAKGSGLVLYLRVLPFTGCSDFAVKHTHSDTQHGFAVYIAAN